MTIIGYDFDDVFVDFTRSLWRFSRERYSIGVEDYNSLTSPHFEEVLTSDKEKAHRIYQEFTEDQEAWHDLHELGNAADSCQAALQSLVTQGHTNVILSAREQSHAKITTAFVETFFEGLIAAVYLCNTYGKTGQRFTKAEMCKLKGVKILVDDNLAHIEDVEANGLLGIPFGCNPWTRRHDLVEDWDELPKRISQLLA